MEARQSWSWMIHKRRQSYPATSWQYGSQHLGFITAKMRMYMSWAQKWIRKDNRCTKHLGPHVLLYAQKTWHMPFSTLMWNEAWAQFLLCIWLTSGLVYQCHSCYRVLHRGAAQETRLRVMAAGAFQLDLADWSGLSQSTLSWARGGWNHSPTPWHLQQCL